MYDSSHIVIALPLSASARALHPARQACSHPASYLAIWRHLCCGLGRVRTSLPIVKPLPIQQREFAALSDGIYTIPIQPDLWRWTGRPLQSSKHG